MSLFSEVVKFLRFGVLAALSESLMLVGPQEVLQPVIPSSELCLLCVGCC